METKEYYQDLQEAIKQTATQIQDAKLREYEEQLIMAAELGEEIIINDKRPDFVNSTKEILDRIISVDLSTETSISSISKRFIYFAEQRAKIKKTAECVKNQLEARFQLFGHEEALLCLEKLVHMTRLVKIQLEKMIAQLKKARQMSCISLISNEGDFLSVFEGLEGFSEGLCINPSQCGLAKEAMIGFTEFGILEEIDEQMDYDQKWMESSDRSCFLALIITKANFLKAGGSKSFLSSELDVMYKNYMEFFTCEERYLEVVKLHGEMEEEEDVQDAGNRVDCEEIGRDENKEGERDPHNEGMIEAEDGEVNKPDVGGIGSILEGCASLDQVQSSPNEITNSDGGLLNEEETPVSDLKESLKVPDPVNTDSFQSPDNHSTPNQEEEGKVEDKDIEENQGEEVWDDGEEEYEEEAEEEEEDIPESISIKPIIYLKASPNSSQIRLNTQGTNVSAATIIFVNLVCDQIHTNLDLMSKWVQVTISDLSLELDQKLSDSTSFKSKLIKYIRNLALTWKSDVVEARKPASLVRYIGLFFIFGIQLLFIKSLLPPIVGNSLWAILQYIDAQENVLVAASIRYLASTVLWGVLYLMIQHDSRVLGQVDFIFSWTFLRRLGFFVLLVGVDEDFKARGSWSMYILKTFLFEAIVIPDYYLSLMLDTMTKVGN